MNLTLRPAVVLCVVFVSSSLLIGCNGQNVQASQQPRSNGGMLAASAAATPTPDPIRLPRLGEKGTLRLMRGTNDTVVFVAPDRTAFDAYLLAQASGDPQAVAAAEKSFLRIAPGMPVECVSGFERGAVQVRLLSGAHRGATGWVVFGSFRR